MLVQKVGATTKEASIWEKSTMTLWHDILHHH